MEGTASVRIKPKGFVGESVGTVLQDAFDVDERRVLEVDGEDDWPAPHEGEVRRRFGDEDCKVLSAVRLSIVDYDDGVVSEERVKETVAEGGRGFIRRRLWALKKRVASSSQRDHVEINYPRSRGDTDAIRVKCK